DLSGPRLRQIVHCIVDPGSVSSAVECLRIGTKLDRYRETARMLLEPWIVEAALARFGEKQLIPVPIDQNPCANWRSPMDMMRQGWSTSLFQALQQWSTRSS